MMVRVSEQSDLITTFFDNVQGTQTQRRNTKKIRTCQTLKNMMIVILTVLMAGLLIQPGSALAAEFFEKFDSDNPFNTVDVGLLSSPAFVDIDNDGDFDAFIGNDSGQIQYYYNDGTQTAPDFKAADATHTNPLAGINETGKEVKPDFADIDGDGKIDVVIGISDSTGGTVKYYLNNGTAESASFVTPVTIISEGSEWANVRPALVDIDSDEDFDLFLGRSDGTVSYYYNNGSTDSPDFQPADGSHSNPLASVSLLTPTKPDFVDIDSDNDMDAFIGYEYGIEFYENTDTGFVWKTSTADNPLNTNVLSSAAENYSDPAFVDIDNDGDADVFIGNGGGTLEFYQNGSDSVDPGDVNGQDGVTLADAILSLQVVVDAVPEGTTIHPDADVNADTRIGLGEAIFALRTVAELTN